MRETLFGTLEVCGHMHEGFYPPEACPGEVDALFPVTADRDDTAIEAWWDRQGRESINPHVITDDYHTDPTPSPQVAAAPLYSSKIHQEAGFSSRVCGGTKTNFVLVNDPYRTPYEWWTSLNADLVPMVEGGKIRQIIVHNGGAMYASTELAVSGTGGNVDVIPVFDERGINTDTIFDDPDLFNVEFDKITIANGAGHGFVERPWSWDGQHEGAHYFHGIQFVERPWSWDGQRLNTKVPSGSYKFYDNVPAYGP